LRTHSRDVARVCDRGALLLLTLYRTHDDLMRITCHSSGALMVWHGVMVVVLAADGESAYSSGDASGSRQWR